MKAREASKYKNSIQNSSRNEIILCKFLSRARYTSASSNTWGASSEGQVCKLKFHWTSLSNNSIIYEHETITSIMLSWTHELHIARTILIISVPADKLNMLTWNFPRKIARLRNVESLVLSKFYLLNCSYNIFITDNTNWRPFALAINNSLGLSLSKLDSTLVKWLVAQRIIKLISTNPQSFPILTRFEFIRLVMGPSTHDVKSFDW